MDKTYPPEGLNFAGYLPLNVTFSYDWDSKRQTGQAYIESVNGTNVAQPSGYSHIFIASPNAPQAIDGKQLKKIQFSRNKGSWVRNQKVEFQIYTTFLKLDAAPHPDRKNPISPKKSAMMTLDQWHEITLSTSNWN